MPQATIASPIKDSEGAEESKGFSKPAGGLSHTPLSFAHLFREKNVNRALVGAGDILNRLMQERHIKWNDLCDYIQERYPAVWEKHREEERRMLAWAEACRYGGDAAQWETFHQALRAVLALRIYWIGLYAVDHEA